MLPEDFQVMAELDVGRLDGLVLVVAPPVVLMVAVVEELDIELRPAGPLASPPRQQEAGRGLVVLLDHGLERRRERSDFVVELAKVAERPLAADRDQSILVGDQSRRPPWRRLFHPPNGVVPAASCRLGRSKYFENTR